MSINIPPDGKGSINLVAWCFINNAWHECFIIEASAQSQSAEVQIKGSLFSAIVPFWHIQSVALKYDDGTIIQSFGTPHISNPESIAYAVGYREAFEEVAQ